MDDATRELFGKGIRVRYYERIEATVDLESAKTIADKLTSAGWRVALCKREGDFCRIEANRDRREP